VGHAARPFSPVGQGRHVHTEAPGHAGESGCGRRHRLAGVGRLHHRAGAPARRRGPKRGRRALGRSRGGLTSKIHLACDGLGRPLAFVVTGGNTNDCTRFTMVMAEIRVPRTGPGRPRTRPSHVIGDKGYSSKAIRACSVGGASLTRSPNGPTRSATVSTAAAAAVGPRPSTSRSTSSATWWNGASTGSSSGAASVRSTRGALLVFPPVGFPEPPPEPGVPVSGHRALHKSRSGVFSSSGRSGPRGRDEFSPVSVSGRAYLCRVEQFRFLRGRPPTTAVIASTELLPSDPGMLAPDPSCHPHPRVVAEVTESDVRHSRTEVRAPSPQHRVQWWSKDSSDKPTFCRPVSSFTLPVAERTDFRAG
jgi:transposase